MVDGTIGVEVAVLKTLEIEWRKKRQRPGPDCEAEVMNPPHNEAGCRGVGCPVLFQKIIRGERNSGHCATRLKEVSTEDGTLQNRYEA